MHIDSTRQNMKIIDLTPDQEPLYFCCLEDWSEEMKEAGDHKEKLKNVSNPCNSSFVIRHS